MTAEVPKSFLTYLLGAVFGAVFGAAVVLVAVGVFHGAPALLIMTSMLVVVGAIIAWEVGGRR